MQIKLLRNMLLRFDFKTKTGNENQFSGPKSKLVFCVCAVDMDQNMMFGRSFSLSVKGFYASFFVLVLKTYSIYLNIHWITSTNSNNHKIMKIKIQK